MFFFSPLPSSLNMIQKFINILRKFLTIFYTSGAPLSVSPTVSKLPHFFNFWFRCLTKNVWDLCTMVFAVKRALSLSKNYFSRGISGGLLGKLLFFFSNFLIFTFPPFSLYRAGNYTFGRNGHFGI